MPTAPQDPLRRLLPLILPLWGIGCAGFLLLAGLMMGGVGLVTWAQISASSGWPTVPGRVLASQVRKSVSHFTDRDARTGRTQHRSTTHYRAEISYEYVVASKEYRSDRYARDSSNSFGASDDAERLAARYPPGTAVQVRYDPDDPSQAVLTPGNALQSQVFTGVGLLLVMLGAGGTVLAIGRMRRGFHPPVSGGAGGDGGGGGSPIVGR
ncbi:MAG: DUF3592 domain-containing protein [Planctomycetes bacterium]|nr:DUF3592 domain-containing protein [Planctomycetota bacterium]